MAVVHRGQVSREVPENQDQILSVVLIKRVRAVLTTSRNRRSLQISVDSRLNNNLKTDLAKDFLWIDQRDPPKVSE